MMSVMSVTVCAMLLVFGVVFCQVPQKCRVGSQTTCIKPNAVCPQGWLPDGECLNTKYCCHLGKVAQTKVCDCKNLAIFPVEQCDPISSKLCKKCCKP